jgi:hypothetical protein
MKKMMIAAAILAAATGCVSVHKNDGGDANLAPQIVKDIVREKYEVGTAPVTATESINVLFKIFAWGGTATHFADAAPYDFYDNVGRVKNGAYANACDQAKCDAIVGARYNVRVEDYYVFKKLTCEITGYPAKITGVELIENKCGTK